MFLNLSFGLNNSEKLMLSKKEESDIVGVLSLFFWELYLSSLIILTY